MLLIVVECKVNGLPTDAQSIVFGIVNAVVIEAFNVDILFVLNDVFVK